MSGGNEAPNPLPAKNVKGLLRFCLEATRGEDAQGSIGLEPMSEERKKWLEEAFTQMSVSPVERMKICLSVIENAEIDTEEGTEKQMKALEELQDWVEDIDIASDFVKINGLRVVPALLSSEVSRLRWGCLELVAVLSQNNPFGQAAVMNMKLLPVLIAMTDTDDHPTVRTKALYATSCVVRSNREAQEALRAHGGLGVLVRAVSSEEEKIKVKATFLMQALCTSDPTFKDCLLEHGAVERLVEMMKNSPHSCVDEHFMSALLAIVSENCAAIERCLSDDLDVKTFLCHRLRLLANKEEFQEERDSADRILQVLNSPPPPPTSNNNNMSLMLAKPT